MPFILKKAALKIGGLVRTGLEKIKRSRTEPVRRVERAKILLQYADGETPSAIARDLGVHRDRVDRCIEKALQFGVSTALNDLPRSGTPRSITAEAETWLVSLACQKPKDLGYSHELWTQALLAKHIREHCHEAGHPCLEKIVKGTVSKILSKQDIKPHRIQYYLEKRDPAFDRKMAEVLHVYQEVEMIREEGGSESIAIVSYDEKPGIQALATVAPDLPPEPGKHSCTSRDHEYERLGTVSLMAGIDLLTGEVLGQVTDRHRSKEFIEFLKILERHYPLSMTIRLVLDNHSAHISKETREYLATVPNRFEFVFTPTHGSWLNIIETFFAKMSKSMLRGIRVSSKDELKERILLFLKEVNQNPVIHRWKWKPDSIPLV